MLAHLARPKKKEMNNGENREDKGRDEKKGKICGFGDDAEARIRDPDRRSGCVLCVVQHVWGKRRAVHPRERAAQVHLREQLCTWEELNLSAFLDVSSTLCFISQVEVSVESIALLFHACNCARHGMGAAWELVETEGIAWQHPKPSCF